MKGDWVVEAFNLCPEITPVTDACTAISLTSLLSFAFVDDTDVQDKQDHLTVVRQVGEIHHSVIGQTTTGSVLEPNVVTVRIDEGIYLTTADIGSGTVQVLDPRDGAAFESDQWMWRRTRRFFLLGTGATWFSWASPQDYAENANSHLDIRVKRKVGLGQELIYTMGSSFILLMGNRPTTMNIATDFAMRAYVKF